MTLIKAHKVIIEEHDSWSGVNYIHRYFNNKNDALELVKKINSYNTLPSAPEYYELARYESTIEGIVIDNKFYEIRCSGEIK